MAERSECATLTPCATEACPDSARPGQAYCSRCRDMRRKREKRQHAKLTAPARYCRCGKQLSTYAQHGLCRGCAGRDVLSALREARA